MDKSQTTDREYRGLGFGMNIYESLESGREGMLFTIISVIGTLVVGMLIGRKLLNIDKETSYLISSGTAICGGSAIAAVGIKPLLHGILLWLIISTGALLYIIL